MSGGENLEKLFCDLRTLEKEVFFFDDQSKQIKVGFKVEGVPNDMKMLAFLAGELSNAAYYFTTFANVSQGDNNFSKTFGPCADSNFDWTPI